MEHVKNFVEYRWKDIEEREIFSKEVIQQQEDKKTKLMGKLINYHEKLDEKFDSQAISNKRGNFINIDDDLQNPSPMNQGKF